MSLPTEGPHVPSLAHQSSINADEKSVLDLPFDVIIEVLQHLRPVDILHLARTTKALRAFLLDYSSQYVWKMAFSNVPDLPPCPEYLSEPAYAHLAFVPECHGCFQHCDIILWELRIRCCDECRPNMTISSHELPPDEIPSSILAIFRLPCTTHYVKLNEHDLRLSDVESTPCHRVSDWENLLTHTRSNKTPIELLATKDCTLWRPTTLYGKSCREWERKQLLAQGDRIKLARQERADQIRRSLVALGWIDDLYYSTCFRELPAVRRPEPLTLAEWSEISHQIIASLPEVRVAQITENYRRRLGEFKMMHRNVLVDLEVYPRATDLLRLSPIRNILERDFNPEIDPSMLQELEGILPGLKRQWSRDAIGTLASFAQQQLGPGSSVDRCNILFTCTQCQRESNRSHPHMDFDTALSHEHLYLREAVEVEEDGHMRSVSEIYEKVVEELGPQRSLEVLQVNKDASEVMDRLAKTLGCQVFIS